MKPADFQHTLPQGMKPRHLITLISIIQLIMCNQSNSLRCSDTVSWWQEGHLVCKKLGVGLLVVTIWLQLCMSYSSSCYHYP